MLGAKRFENVVNLSQDILDMNSCLENANIKVEHYRLIAASFKALYSDKTELYEKLDDQDTKNLDAIYLKLHTNYRTLEDMRDDGIITKEEYDFCLID